MSYKVTLKCPICEKEKEWILTGLCSGGCRVKASRLRLGFKDEPKEPLAVSSVTDILPKHKPVTNLLADETDSLQNNVENSQEGQEGDETQTYHGVTFHVKQHPTPKKRAKQVLVKGGAFSSRGGGVFCPKHGRMAVGGKFPCCG